MWILSHLFSKKMVLNLLPLASYFVWFVIFVQVFVLLTLRSCLLVWRKIVLHQRHPRKRCHLERCCLDMFPDFETYLLRDFKLESGRKVSRSVDWSSNVCYFEVKLHHIITCIPGCWRNCLCLEKTCDGLVVRQSHCWFCCFPQIVCRPEKCHVDGQEFLWVYGHSGLRGGAFFEVHATGCTFSALTVFSDRDCLQSWGHVQHFWSWYRSLGRAAFLEWVASMLIGKRHWELYWLNQMFLSILTY